MSGWTEETLRKAASWQAFKEGRALLDGGQVSEAKAGQTGFQGVVRGGKRPYRVAVTVRSATDLETRCSCPDNQATGAVCCHAVAVGLAALAPALSAAVADVRAPTTPAVPCLAWRITLPANWREALRRAKLAASLAVEPGTTPSPADESLCAWLAARPATATRENLHLHLAGAELASFLDTLSGHPRVREGRAGETLAVRSGMRLQLADLERREDSVRLMPRPDVIWTLIGETFRAGGDATLDRLGEAPPPPEIAVKLTSLAQGRVVDVPLTTFLSQLDVWQQWVEIPEDCWLNAIHFVPAAAAFELTLEGSLQQLDGRLLVRYGGSEPTLPAGAGQVAGLPRLDGDHCEIRNLQAEAEAIRRLERTGFKCVDPTSGRWTLTGESAVLDFLSSALPALQSDWTIVTGTRLAALQPSIAVVRPRIQIQGSGNDWLDFELIFETNDGTRLPAAEVQRLLRSGRQSGRVAGGRHLVVSSEISDCLMPLLSELEITQEQGRFRATARSGDVIREIRKKICNPLDSNQEAQLVERLLPASLTAQPRSYQRFGVSWLMDRLDRHGGALLADDMGLGKTLQTIACIECLFEAQADDSAVVLVVATTSLLGNWRAEFGKFAPGRRVRILHGSGRDQERERVAAGEVVVTSYGTLARDLAWHLRCDYRAVVLDEASLLRNPDTDHARAAAKLRTRHRIALTGTPVENGVRDLWSIFRFVQPGWLGSREEFRERYEQPLADGGSVGPVMERLRLRLSPFLLRRTKEQVAPELPSKLAIDEFCDLSPEQHSVYRDFLHEGRKRVNAANDAGNRGAARMQLLTVLLRLRQICCDLALLESDRFKQMFLAQRSAKLERLLELLDEARSGGHKVLVFSQFQKQLVEIEKRLAGIDLPCLRLDGETRRRQDLVDRFQSADGPPVFLISLKAGGYGLNLTAADTVIHFDPWWNPAAEAQATDRAHRIGQTRPVTVYRLLTRGTVEEKVVRLQARKRELAGAIGDSAGDEAAAWSMADLQGVLG